MLMRAFQGRASEELYNETLMQLYNSLKTLHAIKEPEDAIEGALWINDNALKVKRDNKFEILYDNVYQSMSDLVQGQQPANPKPGQLWISDGALVYYNGIKWDAVKAASLEDFSMDGFEPFLIIDTLQAGANEIIKKQYNIIEEEFIASEGASEFILQKGQYEPMQNKIVVYVNGRILAKAKYLEHNSETIRLITPLHKDERILFQYLPKNAKPHTDYVPLKFHPALREESIIVKEPTHYIQLSRDCLMGEEYMMLYINGRYVANRYYSIEGKRTVRVIAELEPNEEILVQYIDQITYESIPGDEVQVVQDIPYSQYLWPSSDYDKLFMNGKLHLDYETVNKTTIQYPSSAVQGKLISAVHVHPKNLCDIQKRVYAIDKNSGYIQADELNTEFYAITNNPLITESDMSQSNLYPNVTSSSLATSNETRSYILHVQPNIEYRIKRSVNSDTFKITEHTERPTVGSGYTNYIEVPHVDDVNTTHVLTTKPETQFLLIYVDKTGGEWHAPIVTTTHQSSKSVLLIKTQATDTDYVSTVGGIVLSEYIKNSYDYVLAVTYVFGETTGRGKLTKVSFDITDDSQIIIGNINDPLLVFAQGHYLIERDNYKYDRASGLLTLMFPEQLDIGVLTFPRYEGGYILELSDNGEGIITLQKQMTKPLVFVYGEHVQQLVDYEKDGNVIYVKDAQIDMSYAVVDCVDAYGDSMFVSEGKVLYDESKKMYYVPAITNFNEVKPVLFVNGLLINQNDLLFEKNKLYLLSQADENMSYTLLKDDKQRFLHSNIKESNTYSTTVGADQGMLYIDGNVMGDIEAFGVLHLPQTGYQREIKGIVIYDARKGYIVKEWYMFIGDEWVLIDDTSKTKNLNDFLNHYILENKTVHFTNVNTIKNKRCTAWLYKYDETIEYPLLYYWRETKQNTRFEVLPAHGFPVNQNALSVYIDGYRQYPQKLNFPNGVKEIDDHTFEIGAPVPNARLEYIVEMPEHGETKSCLSDVLTSDDIYNQTLKTNIPLLPGFIDLFIDGIRQPKTSYEVVDRHSIILNQFIKDPRYVNVILLEVRKDFSLKESTRIIERDGQTSFACNDDMRSIISTKDFVKVYINGVYVADDYQIVREQGIINIPKIAELNFAKKGHIVSFVWR